MDDRPSLLDDNTLRMKRAMAQDRRSFIGYCLAGLGVVICALALILGITFAASRADTQNHHLQQECIERGGTWINSSCIQVGK